MYYSMISAQVRDDNRYLDEWVEYNFAIGFEHIVIVDHRSEEPVIAKWGDKVTVIRENKTDDNPYDNVNANLKAFKSKWFAVIAVDQFIVLLRDKSINDLLADYEQYGGLSINWSVYGSSGHIKRPEGLVKDNYLWRMPYDIKDTCQDLVQTIANTEHCVRYHNDHTCITTRPIVNEDYVNTNNSAISFSSRTRCKVNHYMTRSHEDWEFKTERARKARPTHQYDENGFHLIDDFCTVYDDVLKDFGKK